jgi:uncharacterized membrane protein
MNLTIILVKIVGAVLLGWTIYSIYKHIKEKKVNKTKDQSVIESFLNNLLLYLWLIFLLVFSTGMIINN